jgi:hypothetical protein
MRDQQEDAMPDLVRIERIVRTSDGFGGYTESGRMVVGVSIPARIIPTAILEGLGQLGRPVEVSNYTVRLPKDTPVKDGDYIIRESDQYELQIEGVKVPRSWDTALTVMAEVVPA